jgi:outer membrane receptor protein involved in Fe transport
MKGNSESETYYPDSTLYMNSSREGLINRKGYNLKGGFDYFMDEKTTLTLDGNYGYFGFGRDMSSNRHIYTLHDPFSEYSTSYTEAERDGNYYKTGTSLSRKFDKKGQLLEASATYSIRETEDWELQHDYIADAENNINYDSLPESFKTIEDESDTEIRLKADYTHPFGEDGKLETGFQSRLNAENEIYTFQDYDPISGEWINNLFFSSEVDFKENIHALYVTYADTWKSFGIQAGLRGEYTDRKIENYGTEEVYIIDRFDYFPSVHLSQEFGKGHQVLLSYSRRIERPDGRELDPFPNYMDPYNIRVGNPALEPEYIDSYEAGYQKRLASATISLEGYYRINKNKITQIKTLREDGIFVHTFENLNRDYSLGSELMLNMDVTRWFVFNGSLNLYNYKLEGSVESEDVSAESTNWDSRMNVVFKLRHDIRIQLTGNYQSNTVTAQGEQKGFLMSDAAVKKDFFKKTLSVTLAVRDVFKTGKREYYTYGTDFSAHDFFTREAPVLTFNLGYLINNYRKPKNGENRDENSRESEIEF